MVIFNSYVKLPEGKSLSSYDAKLNEYSSNWKNLCFTRNMDTIKTRLRVRFPEHSPAHMDHMVQGGPAKRTA